SACGGLGLQLPLSQRQEGAKMSNAFAKRFGFDRGSVDLSNWRSSPCSQWSFQNVSELVPSVLRWPPVAQAEAPASQPELLQAELTVAGKSASLAEHLAVAETDLFCVMQGGEFLADWAAPHADPAKPHLVFSITKSLTALIVGAL